MNREMMRKTGSMQQMAYVRKVTFEEGAAAGLRAYEVKAGELAFTVAADKCLDIVEMSYKGINLNFLSKPGLMNGQRFDSSGFEAQKSIMGGMFFTCGTSNVGRPDRSSSPLSRRTRGMPATMWAAVWACPSSTIWCSSWAEPSAWRARRTKAAPSPSPFPSSWYPTTRSGSGSGNGRIS